MSCALIMLLSLMTAGCIDGPTENRTHEEEAPVEPSNETLVPEPVVLDGTATLANPAHSAFCFRDTVDGEYHKIGQNVDEWRFRLEPEGLAVYWFDSEEDYLEGGARTGVVPKGAVFAEVCKTDGAEPVEYTLTIVHPDHEDA